jgi:RNase P subunit RPR2
MKLQRFIQGVRLNCDKCKSSVTPYLMLEVDDATGLMDSIECVCPDCRAVVRVLK